MGSELLQIVARVGQSGLILGALPLGLSQGDLVGARIDFGEDLACLHVLAFVEGHPDELAIQPAAHDDGVDGRYRAEGLECDGDAATLGLDHTDGRQFGPAPATATPTARAHPLLRRLGLPDVVVPDESCAAQQEKKPDKPLAQARLPGRSVHRLVHDDQILSCTVIHRDYDRAPGRVSENLVFTT